MPVRFGNYSHSFTLRGKPVFAPSDLGRRIGKYLKQRVENNYQFYNFCFHLRQGGHISALHLHRLNFYYCKIDIDNFFYSVARNRIVRNLRQIGIPRSPHYGKWSCVRNPFNKPSYALPYGFVQSPVLATLAFCQSATGTVLQSIAKRATVAVYVDDISISSDDLGELRECYGQLLLGMNEGGWRLNELKSVAPCETMTIFNCTLQRGLSYVTKDRIALFDSAPRTPESIEGFKRYCASVEQRNE